MSVFEFEQVIVSCIMLYIVTVITCYTIKSLTRNSVAYSIICTRIKLLIQYAIAPCQNMPFSVSEFLFIVVLHWLKKIQKQQLTGVF